MNDYNAILDCWISHKKALLDNYRTLTVTVSDALMRSKSSRLKSLENCVVEMFAKYAIIKKELTIENNKTSANFNSFDYFNITEPLHSLLIADMLDAKGTHGQNRLFLNEFLKELGMQDYLTLNWLVSPEKNNVDIILESKEKNALIIVENKSNNAVDQPNQLYRYWYFNIFIPYKAFFTQDIFPVNLPQPFKIIYLVPNNWKRPEAQSLLKPEWLKDDLAPHSIPSNWVTILSFSENIASIFERAILQLHENNHRLRQYLYQYIEKIKSLN